MAKKDDIIVDAVAPAKVTSKELTKIWDEYVIPYLDIEAIRDMMVNLNNDPNTISWFNVDKRSDWEILYDNNLIRFIPETYVFPGE